MSKSLTSILEALDLHPTSQKIYIELLQNGQATARLLSERLMITRPSTYDHLDILKKRGLVVEKELDNKAVFEVDDPKRIEYILEEEITALEEKRQSFSELLPTLLQGAQSTSPTIKFYEGKLGLTHLINDVLHQGSQEVLTMWPYQKMLEVVGEDVLIRFNKRRLQEGISIKTLWPQQERRKNYIWADNDKLTERRHSKAGVNWDMGYTIYGNKVSFISSSKEVYGFIVSSAEFADLMRVQFNALWQDSKK